MKKEKKIDLKVEIHKLSLEGARLRSRVSEIEKYTKKITELELNYEKISYINKGVHLLRRIHDIENIQSVLEREIKEVKNKQDKFIITMNNQLKSIDKNFKYLENKIKK